MNFHRSKKRKAQLKHFASRLQQRVGVTYEAKRLQEQLAARVRRNELTFVRRQSNRITIWLAEIDNAMFKVVYDKKRKTVVTVVPTKTLLNNAN